MTGVTPRELKSPRWHKAGNVHLVTSLPSDQEGEGPDFIRAQSGNVTAILGKPAILNCRVAGVGNKTVSWIRHQDTHLLTAGRSVLNSVYSASRCRHGYNTHGYMVTSVNVILYTPSKANLESLVTRM